jgi:hypothetical protein
MKGRFLSIELCGFSMSMGQPHTSRIRSAASTSQSAHSRSLGVLALERQIE